MSQPASPFSALPAAAPAAVPASDAQVVFSDVSKFYGEVLGVNGVNLTIGAGITSLVGPNGSGKTTLMNLMTGLVRPSRGHLTVLGMTTDQPERLFRQVGYCAQFDSFPRGVTARSFVTGFLAVNGHRAPEAAHLAGTALERVGMQAVADRRVASFSKGMRQRVRLAQAIAHQPTLLVLDEPLNGLDPMARAESIALFRALAAEGLCLIISSHILHEADMMSDRVVLLNHGYVVAEGSVQGVRAAMDDQPMQILVHCDRPAALAARLFAQELVVEARVVTLPNGDPALLLRARDAERFYLQLNTIVAEGAIALYAIAPADDDLQAVYQYLIGGPGGTA